MKVLVILRKLWKDEDKVIHSVLLVPKSVENGMCVSNWADDMTKDAHRQMTQQFVEFGKAEFSYEIQELKEV